MKEDLKNQSIHRHVYLDIERKIATGEIAYLEQLPTLPYLCRQYGVSAAPIRQALDRLAREGTIEKRRGRGKGTVVIKRLVPTTLRALLMLGHHDSKTPIESYHEVFDLIAGIREASRTHGCRLQMVSPDGFDSLPSDTRSLGYLIIGMTDEDCRTGADLAAQHGAVMIRVNTPGARSDESSVSVDMRYGAYSAVSYLAQIGHRGIAYIGNTSGEWSAPRFAGYCEAIAEHRIAFRSDLVRQTSGLDEQEDEAALVSLLGVPHPPTALFAASDYRALHILNACRRRGIDVPGQMSVCGYDDIGEAEAVEPGLTTVHHPCHEVGRLAVEMLYERIHDSAPPSHHVIRPHVVVRESCTTPCQRAGELTRQRILD